jgi:30S ribosome assembly GTPase
MELGYVPPHKFLEHKQWRETAAQSLGLAPGSPESGIADFTLNNLFGELALQTPAAAAGEPATPSASHSLRRLICQRCYELEHYGRVTPAAVDASYFLEAIKPIRDSNALVVNIVDIFDFQGSFIPVLRKYSGSNPVIIAANKVDLLPDGVQVARVKEWLHRAAKSFGAGVVSVQLFSAKTGEGVDDLASAIEWYRDGRPDVVVMGCANVGKSTLINKLIEKFKGPEQRKVTVSAIPGTTLSLIRLPFGENAWLFDTPGIFSDKQIIRHLSEDDIKKITPVKRLKPVVERINPGKTVFIAGLARVDYMSGPDGIFFTFFTSNDLYLHKTLTEKADDIYREKKGSMLSPPSLLNKTLPALVAHDLEFENTNVRHFAYFCSYTTNNNYRESPIELSLI